MSWPKSCESWATALFDIIKKNAIDKAFGKAVQEEIFALVQETTKNGTLWTRNWDDEPPVPTAAKLLIAQGLYEPIVSVPNPVPPFVPQPTVPVVTGVERPSIYHAAQMQTSLHTKEYHYQPGQFQQNPYQPLQQPQRLSGGYGTSGHNNPLSSPQNISYLQEPLKRVAKVSYTLSSSSISSSSTSTHPYHTSSSTTALPLYAKIGTEHSAIDTYTQRLLDQQNLLKRPRTEETSGVVFNHKKNKRTSKFDVSKFDAYTKDIPLNDVKSVTSALVNTTDSTHIISDPRAQEDSLALGSRSKRFATTTSESQHKHGFSNVEDQSSVDDQSSNGQPIVGTCEILEKRYFRLIGPPHPSSVRPESILRKALASLVSKHRDGIKYLYISDQLKSIRQDLSVQHIRNALTIEVYEFNARLALENGDPGEFNQCQTQLEVLYKTVELIAEQVSKEDNNAAITDSRANVTISSSRCLEFSSYRILYSLYTGDPIDPSVQISRLTSKERLDPWVRHSINVVAAFVSDNFSLFFSLYRSAPNMSSYLMDWLSHKIRTRALLSLSRSVKTHIPISFLRTSLCFASESDCSSFLKKMGAVLVDKSTTHVTSATSTSSTSTTEPPPSSSSSSSSSISSLSLPADSSSGGPSLENQLHWEIAASALKPFKDALMTALHEEVQRDGAGVFF